jgi:hypothetical protein
MIVKGTKQLGSFKRGINLYVPKKKVVAPPAPSGIVAATAGNLVITFDDYPGTATYQKYSDTFWAYIEGDFQWYLTWDLDSDSKWDLRIDDPVARAKSQVATSAIIPTTGWVYTEGSGFPITIIAA